MPTAAYHAKLEAARLRRAAITDAYRAGAGIPECMRQFGLSYSRIHQILVAEGVALRPRGRPRKAAEA